MAEDTSDEQEMERPAWVDRDRMEKLIGMGLTYAEIADRLGDDEGPTEQEVGRWARKFGINPGRRGAEYTNNQVPMRHQPGNDEIEWPLPEHIAENYDVEEGDFVRHVPQLHGQDIEFDLVVHDDTNPVDGTYSNERAVVRPDTRHLMVRSPRLLAAHVGLLEHGGTRDGSGGDGVASSRISGQGDVTVVLDEKSKNAIHARFAPALRAWTPRDRGQPPEGLEPMGPKTLIPLKRNQGEATPDNVEKYRLEFPTRYVKGMGAGSAADVGYELTGGDKVVVRFGVIDAEAAIIIDFDADPDEAHPRQVRSIQTITSGVWEREGGRSSSDIIDEHPEEVEGIRDDLRAAGKEPSDYAVAQEAVERGIGDMGDFIQNRRAIYIGKAVLHGHGIGIGQGKPSVELIPGDGYIAIKPY